MGFNDIYFTIFITYFSNDFLNIISFLHILIFLGFKKFILDFVHFEHWYFKKFILILVSILFLFFYGVYSEWKNMINKAHISNKFGIKFLLFFSCSIISIIIYYPQRVLINIVYMIFIWIDDGRSFSIFFRDLNSIFL